MDNLDKIDLEHPFLNSETMIPYPADPPKLQRVVSSNISSQDEQNCWNYALAKVIHKVFKNIIPELENEDTRFNCDRLYSISTFKEKYYSDGPNGLIDLCHNMTNFLNLVLYIYILLSLKKIHNKCGGASIPDTVNISNQFFELFNLTIQDDNIDNIKKNVREQCSQFMIEDNYFIFFNSVIAYIFSKASSYHYNFNTFTYGRMNIISKTIGYRNKVYSVENLFKKIKRVIDKNLYLRLSIDLSQSTKEEFFKYFLDREIDSTKRALHSMTIVDYNENLEDAEQSYIVIKNSWGQDEIPIINFSLKELREHSYLYITWVEFTKYYSYKKPKSLTSYPATAAEEGESNTTDDYDWQSHSSWEHSNSDYTDTGGKKKYIKKNKSKKNIKKRNKSRKKRNKTIKKRNSIKRRNK